MLKDKGYSNNLCTEDNLGRKKKKKIKKKRAFRM
jgi:hypothetical protein